jgi:8-oxo-dGTP pyrophosphatase MutT (NUDIX family)
MSVIRTYMTSPPRPKVKSMGLIQRQKNGKTQILGTRGHDTIKNEIFYRLIGGHVEMGEYARDALVREIDEELELNLDIGELVGWNENIFIFNGVVGHEVIALFYVSFPPDIEPQDQYDIHDCPGVIAEWVNRDDVESGIVKLYPMIDLFYKKDPSCPL